MKKLFFIFLALPLFMLAQEVRDTSQNRIVVDEDVNECVQGIFKSTDGAKQLLRKITSDREHMRELHNEVMSDPNMQNIIRNMRTGMHGQEGMQRQDQTRTQDQTIDQNRTQDNTGNEERVTRDNVGFPENETMTQGDIDDCVDKVYDNPDAIKLLISLYAGSQEKMQQVRSEINRDPEMQEMIRTIRSEMNQGNMHDGQNPHGEQYNRDREIEEERQSDQNRNEEGQQWDTNTESDTTDGL
jgi:hypothetical protein